MFRHDRRNCYKFSVNARVYTKLYMFDKTPSLNMSKYQYSVSDENWLHRAPYDISMQQPLQQAQ